MYSFPIRSATPEEYHEIVTEPHIVEAIKYANGGKIPKHEKNSYIVTFNRFRLLFTANEIYTQIFEFHIACPKSSIRASRLLTLMAIEWLRSSKSAKAVTTTCPEGTIANMARKLGFTEIHNSQNGINFVLALT